MRWSPSSTSGRLDARRLRSAIQAANVPALTMVLVQLTGELHWLEDPYRPARSKGLDDNDTGGLPEETQAEIREAATRAILAWAEGTLDAIDDPSDEMLVSMLSVAMGDAIPPEYGPMISANLRASAGGQKTPAKSKTKGWIDAIIIGAGFSGICAAVKLREAGIPFILVERDAQVGGTWEHNRYPGVSVDTPSHLYSYSFAPFDWPRFFASGDQIRGYLREVVDERELRDSILLKTNVVEVRFEEATQSWAVETMTVDGEAKTLRASILISAVGAFNKPSIPASIDFSSFGGRAFHASEWPSDLDIARKQVAVVGNGATAMQVVPAISSRAESVTVFQRAPQWIAPFDKFEREVPEDARYLFKTVPLYYAWYRARLSWLFNDSLHEALQKDPEWQYPDRSINEKNDRYRKTLVRYIQAELGDRPDLMREVLPTYPPLGKRLLLDNGWYRALRRDNVHLVSDPVTEIRSDRLVTQNGSQHIADVIVFATGFDVVRFLSTMRVVGRNGRALSEVWNDDDAQAYLGMTVPGFPNLFMLYGPNTQQGHGGSLISALECQVNYVVKLISEMLERNLACIELKEKVYNDYSDRVAKAHERMIWTHPGFSTYYRNSSGRVVVNSPFRLVDFWWMTHRPNLDDFNLTVKGISPRDLPQGTPCDVQSNTPDTSGCITVKDM
jgi:4-hydroxyacetophenone monooxygenase